MLDVDALNDVLALVESLTLVDVDALNDVLALVESLTLVDVDYYLMCVLVESPLLMLIHLMMCFHLLNHSRVDVDPLNDVLAC